MSRYGVAVDLRLCSAVEMTSPRLLTLAALLLGLTACTTGAPIEPITAEQTTADPVTADIVWQPGMSGLQIVRERCRAASGQALVDCFATGSADIGASEAAVAFSKRLPQPGFARDFRPGAPVAIAYVYYVFRANEMQGWFIVNGDPPMIDVDDPDLVDFDRLRDDPRIRRIAEEYPKVTLWPGDRSGMDGPEIRQHPDGGVSVIVGYELHDYCHACAVIGRMRYAFDFDADGRLTGTRLVSVEPMEAGLPE